ncbi:MAG: SDR family NAD(P)-dependent oxidoreductase [SAR202 cluster bacterium]|nr:SDR family NAD(P)-dependent oxidoreductase [SAR202 cluster bacterium]
MDWGFKDAVALVTGGNSGIGRSIAMHLAEAGAQVIMVARDRVKGEAVRKEIIELGGRAEFHSVQLGDHDAVKALLEDIDRRYGALNVLVNCAGGSERNQGVDESFSVMQRWDRVSGGNFLSAFLATTYALPIMQRTGGAIVNISSTGSIHGNYGLYGAMKAGLEGMTRSMALEYAPLGIRVNAISPGWVETPFTAPTPDDPAHIEWATTASLLGRMGHVDEIAMPTLFFASKHSSYITGTTLIVDGGNSIIDATTKQIHAR